MKATDKILKYVTGIILAIIVVVILRLANHFLLKTEISEFMIGWTSCMGYFWGKNNLYYWMDDKISNL